jgi:hypothetical protein
MRIFYQMPDRDRVAFSMMSGFYGLEPIEMNPSTKVSVKPSDIFFNGQPVRDKAEFWGDIQNRFSKLIDFSGTFARSPSSEPISERLSGGHRLTYQQPYFSHRRKSEELFSGDFVLSPSPPQENEKILIAVDGFPFLVWKEIEGLSAVYSTCDLLNAEGEMSFRRLVHLDWFWRAVEILSGDHLRHHQWANFFSIRIDDVIGDAKFNILKPMAELANFTLLAVDLGGLKQNIFQQNMLPFCGEICIHAHTHYKYVPREKTRSTYLSWGGEEYDDAELKSNFRDFDELWEAIPPEKRASVLSPHGFQIGLKALPYLQYRNIRHLITPFAPGEPFTSQGHEPLATTPFGNVNFHHTLWGKDLYLFYHLWVKPYHARWGEPQKYLLSEEESSATDMLYGLRMFDPPDKYYQPLQQIIERIEDLRQVTRIVGFPLILFTHETALDYLGQEGWTDLCGYIQRNILGEYKAAKISDILNLMVS